MGFFRRSLALLILSLLALRLFLRLAVLAINHILGSSIARVRTNPTQDRLVVFDHKLELIGSIATLFVARRPFAHGAAGNVELVLVEVIAEHFLRLEA